MADNVWIEIIGGAVTLIVAIIAGIFSYKTAKLNKKIEAENAEAERKAEERRVKAEERAAQRHKESLLNMKLCCANTQLTVGVAMALKNGHANGEIEEGLIAVKNAKDEYEDFLKGVALMNLQ